MARKYLLGSKMLKMDNARDEDWVVFEDKRTSFGKEAYKSTPFFNTLIEHFIRGGCTRRDPYKAEYIFQLSKGFHDDADYAFAHFNILEHRTAWVGYLKAYMNDARTETKATGGEVLPKEFYHILYQYHMITENVHWISDEAKVDVQKIHDLEMSSDYFYTLKGMINSLES